MMGPVSVVGSGVDSLYVAVRGQLRDGLVDDLLSRRDLADGGELTVELGTRDPLVLHTHGKNGYRLWLSGADFQLFLGTSDRFPPAYVAIHSAFIHAVGIEEAVGRVDQFLCEAIVDGPAVVTPSRIDLYADTQGWTLDLTDIERFVCRASTRRVFLEQAEVHARGRRTSGFVFGKGALVARVYDKTLQMRVTGQTWPAAVWHGVDPRLCVWRVEFQFRGAALVRRGTRTLREVLDSRQALWRYAMRWLSLRAEADHARTCRWRDAPEWAHLANAPIGSPCSPLIPALIRAADERRLLSGFVGYASSIAASHGLGDLHTALSVGGMLAGRYLDDRGTAFVDLVLPKRERRRAAFPRITGDDLR